MTTKDKIITLAFTTLICSLAIAVATAMAWTLYIIFGN